MASVAQWIEGQPGNQRGSLVQFPVWAHAWVAGWVPSWGHARGNQSIFLSHINVSLPLFLPPFSLSRNKQINKIFKK